MEVSGGKSVTRAYLNFALLKEELKGKTIDIGGGRKSSYLSFIPRKEGVTFETFDLKSGNNVNFETDTLPAVDNSYDTVLFLNVMEHIFNYQHIANEVVRITKNDGQLIGFVPFLMWYHPDHSDFFRYTDESLRKIFECAGARCTEIIPIEEGPFIASFQMFNLSLPLFLRPVFLIIFYGLDWLYFMLRRPLRNKYVLGYLFKISK